MQIFEKIKLLDQASVECNWGNPNSKIIDQPDWAQIITPSSKHSSANCVFRSRLAPPDAVLKIDRTIAFYKNMNVPFRWLVTPLSEPSNLKDLLLARGLSLHYEATAMLSSVNEQLKTYDPQISVVQATLENIDIYVETFVRCWQLPHEQVAEFKKDVIYGLKNGEGRFLPYVAHWKNEPVGTSALLNLPSGAYLAAGTVDPKYRGLGIYKAMVAHRAQVAEGLGHDNLLIHAKKLTSAPICKKLGFEEVYEYQVFSRELL